MKGGYMRLKDRVAAMERRVMALEDRTSVMVCDEQMALLGNIRYSSPPINEVVLELADHCGLELKYKPAVLRRTSSFIVRKKDE